MRFDIGTVFWKEFEDGVFKGRVVGYTKENDWYSVEYTDGDKEQLDHDELHKLLHGEDAIEPEYPESDNDDDDDDDSDYEEDGDHENDVDYYQGDSEYDEYERPVKRRRVTERSAPAPQEDVIEFSSDEEEEEEEETEVIDLCSDDEQEEEETPQEETEVVDLSGDDDDEEEEEKVEVGTVPQDTKTVAQEEELTDKTQDTGTGTGTGTGTSAAFAPQEVPASTSTEFTNTYTSREDETTKQLLTMPLLQEEEADKTLGDEDFELETENLRDTFDQEPLDPAQEDKQEEIPTEVLRGEPDTSPEALHFDDINIEEEELALPNATSSAQVPTKPPSANKKNKKNTTTNKQNKNKNKNKPARATVSKQKTKGAKTKCTPTSNKPASPNQNQKPRNPEDCNDDDCYICANGGLLLCCDFCPKVFHLQCHIPKLPCVPQLTSQWKCCECHAAGQKKLSRCGECEACHAENCGNCKYCLDKPKFGGNNIHKQACVKRRCRYMSYAQTYVEGKIPGEILV